MGVIQRCGRGFYISNDRNEDPGEVDYVYEVHLNESTYLFALERTVDFARACVEVSDRLAHLVGI